MILPVPSLTRFKAKLSLVADVISALQCDETFVTDNHGEDSLPCWVVAVASRHWVTMNVLFMPQDFLTHVQL